MVKDNLKNMQLGDGDEDEDELKEEMKDTFDEGTMAHELLHIKVDKAFNRGA